MKLTAAMLKACHNCFASVCWQLLALTIDLTVPRFKLAEAEVDQWA